MKKVSLEPIIEAGEPVLAILVTPRGLEKSLLFYEEDNPEALEAVNQLLARISHQLMLLDDAIRKSASFDGFTTTMTNQQWQ